MSLKSAFFAALTFLFVVTSTAQNAQIEVVTQEKIQGIITILSYSPDGSLIASGSDKENAIKVWDVNSGKIIGKLEGHTDETSALHFNEDGTALISSAKDNRVILWSLINWKMMDSISIASPVNAFTLDPTKPNTFYSGSESGAVYQWTQKTFQNPIKLYTQEHPITTIDLFDHFIVTGSNSGRIVVFDFQDKKKLVEEKIHSGAIIGINFYNDGKGLITAGTSGKIHLWDIQDLSDSKHFSASAIAISAYDANVTKNTFVTASQNNVIKVWNLEGEKLHEFKSRANKGENKQPVKAIKISPDGSTMASSGFQRSPSRKSKENNNVIRIWDLNRGSLYSTLEGSVNPIYTFDFHPTKNELVTLGDDNTLTFWDFNTAEKFGEVQMQEPKRELASLRLPSATGGDGKIDRRDIDRGKRLKNILDKASKGDFSGVRDETKERGKNVGVGLAKRMFKERSIIKYSAKGSFLITKQESDEIRLYEFHDEKPVYIEPLFSYQLSINALLTSPDEKYLAVLGAGDSAVSIVNLESQKFVRKLSTPAPKENFRFIYEANSLAFSPDGKYLAVCFNTGKTFVYNTGGSWSLAFENILPDNLGYVESPFVNFSKDGKYMVVKSMLGLKKYNTDNFDIFASEPLAINGYSAPMDKPQDYAISIKDDYIYFENLFTGDVKKSIHVTPNQITHISINPKGMVGITFKSGQFQLLNPTTGEEEILLVGEGDNYIFKTSENFYKVSKEGYDLVTFRIGNQAFPFEQFDAIFNRPDLVLKKLGCPDQELMSLYEKAYLKRIKKLGLQPTTEIVLNDIPRSTINNAGEIPAITENKSVNVAVDFQDAKGLKNYNIWVNNVPVHGKNGKSISGTSKSISEDINLIHGLNKIQIACRNGNGYESLIQTFYVEKQGEEPERDLYLVTIGTSKYKDARYNLNYPVKDATDFIELMQSNPNGLYRNVKTKNLFDGSVTVDNVGLLRSFLNESNPNDVVIVFVAGHGVLDANFDYYFGTHDIDFTNPSEKGLAYEKLEHILDGIKANRKILIMDTCHSGEVDKEDVFFAASEEQEESDDDIAFRSVGAAVVEDKTKATPSRLAGELFNDLRKGTGATVISSAGGVEFAMESDEWKNGLFTYCMLNGLKNRTADLDGDGTIMLLELQEYVVDKVRALSHGRQIPNSRIQNIELDFPIW
ncbi:MAG: WD40 repeat protein [Crocinitomix sp.]|jgi:WD40 repeat protein